MNNFSATPLVPEKEVYPVCTNGLQTGTMVVTSQNKMCNAKRHYIATHLDKPTNFKCVYLGILVAIIGGIITALMASGVGATIAGLLIATLAGIIASYGLGGAVCRYCLESAVWDKFHPNIIIDGKFAIIGSSKLICTPLPFLSPGKIEFFYDKDVAKKTAEIYATQNVLRIFAGATTGWAIPKTIMAAPSFFTGFVSNGLTVLTVLKAGGGAIGFFAIPKVTNFIEEKSSDIISEMITGSAADTDKYKVEDDGSLKDVTDGYDNIVEGEQAVVTKLHKYAASNSKPRGDAMKTSWILEKLDPRYYTTDRTGLRSTYMKEGWSVKKEVKNIKKTRNSPSAKLTTLVNSINAIGNFLGKIVYKCMAKNLEKWKEDAESTAIANIGIYEKQIE